MKKGRRTTYAEKERDGEVKRLKDANRRLKSENEKLKSELKTYEAAFQKNIQFLKGKTKDLTVEQLIEGAKKEQNLKEIETEKELTFKEMEDKWRCKLCSRGRLVFIKIPRQDGTFYIRKCDNPKCKKVTRLKRFDEKVEIS